MDYVIIGLIAILAFLAVFYIIRSRKKGGGCHGSCSGCSQNCPMKSDPKNQDTDK